MPKSMFLFEPPPPPPTHKKKIFFSSPEPLAHGELLISLDVCCQLSAMCRQQLLQKTSPKLLAGLNGMILIWPSLKIVQMVPILCISRSHRLKIDFKDDNFKKSSCLKPQGLELWYLICSITLWTFTKLVQIMPLGQKRHHPGGYIFYIIGLYREKHEKIFLSETIRHRALIFGMKHNLVDLYQVCSNYAPGVTCFTKAYIGENMKNLLV